MLKVLLEQVFQECYWDYSVCVEDLEAIIDSNVVYSVCIPIGDNGNEGNRSPQKSMV
jgi:hypothetical protein